MSGISLTHLIALAAVSVSALSLVMGLLMVYVKKSNKINEQRINEHIDIDKEGEKRLAEVLDKLNDNMEHLNSEIHELKVDVTGHYVKKEELNNQNKDNKQSHENFWTEIKDLRERMVEIETKVSGSRGRRIKKQS
jgi:chromosome segregation ATPase